MKKMIFTLLLFAVTGIGVGQNKKIYISKHGGTKKLLILGKTGYNTYHFTNFSDKCDTLICYGSGFEICKVDKEVIRLNPAEKEKYKVYNKALQLLEKHVKKNNSPSGYFITTIHSHKLSIRYSNADKNGNADIEIELI